METDLTDVTEGMNTESALAEGCACSKNQLFQDQPSASTAEGGGSG